MSSKPQDSRGQESRGIRRTGKPTINDVARLSGVSKKTVSRVINRSPLLNDETRKRVLEVIEELGYVPNPQARALALRTNFLIGLIHDNPNAQMVLNVQQGILEGLQGTDFSMIVQPIDRGSATRSAAATSGWDRPISTIPSIWWRRTIATPCAKRPRI